MRPGRTNTKLRARTEGDRIRICLFPPRWRAGETSDWSLRKFSIAFKSTICRATGNKPWSTPALRWRALRRSGSSLKRNVLVQQWRPPFWACLFGHHINVRDYLFNGRNRYVVTAASEKDDDGNDAGAAVLPLVTLAKDDMNKQKKTPLPPENC